MMSHRAVATEHGSEPAHSGRYVLVFDAITEADDGLVGGKGAGLARLTRADFPVPPGFVVLTDAYSEFLRQGRLMERINPLLDVVDYADPRQLELQSDKIRELIIANPIPAEIETALAQAYTRLGSDRYVAVRSSGTAEDTAQASFAGLHDTYLHIEGAPALALAVRRCWASMWTGRAIAYRHSTGFSHTAARIAVVVQVMVDSDVSGVMFTCNPLTARTDEIVINASWGLGEAVVSGMVVPDELILSAEPVAVKRRTLGGKEMEMIRDPATGQGTVAVPVAADRRATFSVTDAQAVRLAELGLRVMAHHGGKPQDLEWAIAGGDVYLLQSRPITGVEFTWDQDVDRWQTLPEDEATIWSGGWAAEFWSGAITPLFYSIRSREIWERNQRIFTLLGFRDLLEFRLLKYRRATVFYNVELDTRLYRYLLPRALRGGALSYHPPHLRESTAKERMDVGRFLKAMARVYLLRPDQSISRWERTLRTFSRENIDGVRFASREELQTWPEEKVRHYAANQSRIAAEFLERTSLGVYVYSKFMLGYLRLMIQHWCKGADSFTFQDMISGLPVHTMMAEENRELWHLAQDIRTSPVLATLFQRHPGQAFFQAASETEEGRRFIATYAGFVQRHGHRGHADRDIYFDRRVENPELDLDSIGLLLKAVDPVPPETLEARLVERREQATRRVLAEIEAQRFGRLKAALLTRVHRWVMTFLVMRDDWRHSIDRVTLAKKWAYQELGRRAFSRGLVAAEKDFYFLSEQELFGLLDGRIDPAAVAPKIAARKHVHERFLTRQEVPPPFLAGSTPADLDPTDETAGGEVLKGTGISRGRISGRARVIAELADIGKIEPDEILVCNSTDPAWAPVFPVIGGLVLEMGGMLSHGACLSREFGLPAVQVRNAMRRIRDGETIEVSGDAGEVRLLGAAADAGSNHG